MRLGVVILPELPWAAARDRWRRAEALGFDHAWTYDHLAWRSLRDSPWFGAIPTLTAAATATEQIRLGPLVASPNFRHPVPFARELIALDDISGGRLTLGLGAGGTGWDATVLGHAPWSSVERGQRFREFVELLDQLLSAPATTQHGRFYSADGARSAPGCVQRPRVPFAIAATGPLGMRMAASRGEIWVTTGDRLAERPLQAREGARVVARQMKRLDEACAGVGREPGSLRRLVLLGPSLDQGFRSLDSFQETLGAYAESGVTDLVVHWPRPAEPYAGDAKTFEQIVSRVLPARESSAGEPHDGSLAR